MITPNSSHLLAVGIAVITWGTSLFAADDVNVISAPAKTTSASKKGDDEGSVVHKSSHKKKTETAAATTAAPAADAPKKPAAEIVTAKTPAPVPQKTPIVIPTKPTTTPSTVTVVKPVPIPPTTTPAVTGIIVGGNTPLPPPPQAPPPTSVGSVAVGPTVETGLPVAKYPGMGTPIRGVSTYVPPSTPVKSVNGSPNHLPYFAQALPSSVIPLTSAAAGTFSNPPGTPTSTTNFVFKDLTKKVKNTYPWRSRIVTTIFWIGEGATPISSTTNMASSWDEDWRANNHGSDSPNNRNGYASGGHASTLNPFYVALPFNDLAFPDKAKRWLPYGWARKPKDGKQVSACKDRWVMIKNSKGDICYAQWEDVGPLNYSDAEYVFGSEPPDGLNGNRAGLDVSPAVAEYLGIDHKDKVTTSWRFVDEEDVRPGPWLKLDEQALLYTAMHQLMAQRKKNPVPIQKASEPIDDPSKAEANKKKVRDNKG